MLKRFGFTKSEISWSLYDVGNSAFILLLTAVIPIYVKSVGRMAELSDIQTTAHWGFVQSAATFFIALLAPLMGAMADFMGKKKKFFSFFVGISLLSVISMAITDNYYVLLAVNLFAAIGYAGANNFYDAFLIDVSSNERMDLVSSFGFAIGYIGSCIPFVLSIFLILVKPFGLTGTMPVKISLGITAVWWLLFTLPLLKNVKQKYGILEKPENLVAQSFKNSVATFRKIIKDKRIALFLLAYFFYIDGVDTIIKMSTTFGSDVGIEEGQMILALLVTQIIAFPAVLVSTKFVKHFSAKGVLMFSIAVYTGICIFGFVLSATWQFWVLAVCVAIVQGTIQALSRSYFGKLIIMNILAFITYLVNTLLC